MSSRASAQVARAVVYTRISSDRTGREAGVRRQREDCEALARDLGWEVVAVETDNDVSAFSGARRPGWERVLSMLESGEATALVAWHPDRCYRRLADLERLVVAVEGTGARVATVKAGDVDLATASGRMTARIIGAVATAEAERLGERTSRALLQRAREGRPAGGHRPLGWADDRVSPHPVEAPLVADAADRLLAGESMASLAREMTETLGRLVKPSSLRRCLLAPEQVGQRVYRGAVVGEAQAVPLLDADTARAVRALLTDPTTPRRCLLGRGKPPRSLLGGRLLRCTSCADAGRDEAACRVSSDDGWYRCRSCGRARPIEQLDALVLSVVGEHLARLGERGALRAPVRKRARATDPATVAEDLRARLDALADAAADGTLSAVDFAAAAARLRTRLEGAEAAVAASQGHDATAALLRGGDARTAFQALPRDRQRAVITEVVEHVDLALTSRRGRSADVDPAEVTVRWRRWTQAVKVAA